MLSYFIFIYILDFIAGDDDDDDDAISGFLRNCPEWQQPLGICKKKELCRRRVAAAAGQRSPVSTRRRRPIRSSGETFENELVDIIRTQIKVTCFCPSFVFALFLLFVFQTSETDIADRGTRARIVPSPWRPFQEPPLHYTHTHEIDG